jgi:hypothetical protein
MYFARCGFELCLNLDTTRAGPLLGPLEWTGLVFGLALPVGSFRMEATSVLREYHTTTVL